MYEGGEPHPPRATEGCWGAIPQVTRGATRSSIKQRGEGKKPPRPVSSGKGSSVDSLPTTRNTRCSTWAAIAHLTTPLKQKRS